MQVNLCFIYLDPAPCITYLEKLLNEKPDERAESGVVFDREAYLRDVEGFDDREVRHITGKGTSRVSKQGGETNKRTMKDFTTGM